MLSFAATGSGVANFTHLSGLVAGWLYFKAPGWLLRFKGLRPEIEAEAPGAAEKKEQETVDAILDKISRKGEGALSSRERDILDEYAKKKGGRA